MTASAPQATGLADVAAGAHAAVGDDLDVITGVEQMLDPRRRRVGDGRGLGHADAQHAAGGAGGAGTDAHQHTDGAGAHQVQRGRIRGAAADDDRYRQLGDEFLQVERLDDGADVLGADDRSLDDQHVEAGVDARSCNTG